MNIIKIRHPYQSEQIPEDDVVFSAGIFRRRAYRTPESHKDRYGNCTKRRIEISIDDFQSASIYCL